jgi:hypothetical protein
MKPKVRFVLTLEGAAGSVSLFESPTVVGLKVRLDRPIDRDHPCCRNICIIGPAEEPYGGALHCADCGRGRGWISKTSAQWIEQVGKRFGAPRDTPIVVRRAHTYVGERPR